MNKKGLNDIITVTLLILLGIGGVAILWGFFSKTISGATEEADGISDMLNTELKIIPDSIKKNSEGDGGDITRGGGEYYLDFKVERKSGEGKIVALRVIATYENDKKVIGRYPYRTETGGIFADGFNRYEIKNVKILISGVSSPSQITVIPIFSINGKEKDGSVQFSYKLNKEITF